jgi:hypothetical protein
LFYNQKINDKYLLNIFEFKNNVLPLRCFTLKYKQTMELTNEQKQAIEYGVPMPETCVQIDWQGQTFFFWLKSISGKWYLVNKAKKPFSNIICYHEANILQIEKSLILDWVIVVPAPQMHDIAPLLPKIVINNELTTYYIDLVTLDSGNQYLRYNTEKGICYKELKVEIKNHHYAQAYAELYIKLKNEGLLK